MIERSLTQNLGKSIDTNKNGATGTVNVVKSGLSRPTNLPTEHRRIHNRGATTYSSNVYLYLILSNHLYICRCL